MLCRCQSVQAPLTKANLRTVPSTLKPAFSKTLCDALFATFVIAGDYLHLLANYREYELAVAASPGSTQAFGWGSGGFVGSHQFSRRLVYSPAAAPQSDATAWQSEVGGPAPRWQVKHLFGHYYVVEAAEG